MGIVDTLQVGHVSDTALAAASLGGTMTWLVVVTMNGLVGALDPLTSQARPVRFYLTLVPVRPRRRGERRSLRTLPGDSLRPHLAFNPRPRRLSTPTDAFELHPDVASRGPSAALRRTARTISTR